MDKTVPEERESMDPQKMKAVVEALLISADRPLTVRELSKILRKDRNKVDKKEVEATLAALQEECAKRAYELVEVASGYRYQTRPDYADWLAKLWEQKPPRYSRAALETLALIVYQQPITRAAIEDIRGVAVSTNIIRNFEDRGWIKVVGHKEVPGRPALYATTDTFLDDFGISSLEQLPDLPDSQLLADKLPVHLAALQEPAEEPDSTPQGAE